MDPPIEERLQASRASKPPQATLSQPQPPATHGSVEDVAPIPDVIPFYMLTDRPALTDCPYCNHRATTLTSFVPRANYSIIDILCCTIFMDSGKDVVHRCGHCGNELARWYRLNGETQVLADASRMQETSRNVALP